LGGRRQPRAQHRAGNKHCGRQKSKSHGFLRRAIICAAFFDAYPSISSSFS
jgi:hypothetical protein